jgi:purine-binding chemotaxis protein CheW
MSRAQAAEIQAKAGKYLTFKLANEVYGIAIHHVREIIGMAPITAVPNTPPSVRGLINLRGKIISVVDLRLKFNMQAREMKRETCIVVVAIRVPSGQLTIGTVVDSVCEVVQIESENMEPPPTFGVRVDTSFLMGLARSASEVRLLLDIEKVLSDDETRAIETVVAREQKETVGA